MRSPSFLTKRESWSQACPNSLIVQVGGVSRTWSAPKSSTQHQLWVCELEGTIHTPTWQTPCALGFSEFRNVAVSKLCASRIGPGTVWRKATKRPPRLLQSTHLLPFSCVHCTSYDPEDLRRVTLPLPCRGGDWGLTFLSIWAVWASTKPTSPLNWSPFLSWLLSWAVLGQWWNWAELFPCPQIMSSAIALILLSNCMSSVVLGWRTSALLCAHRCASSETLVCARECGTTS